jgi:hypothetical protein
MAYIVISPYATRNGTPARLDTMVPGDPAAAPPAMDAEHAPVLMLSSLNDADAYGIVTDPAVRRLAFARLGPDRQGASSDYYLEMQRASHRWLEGLSAGLGGGGEPAPRRALPPPMTPGGIRNPQGLDKDDVSPGGDDDESTPEKKAQREAARAELVHAHSRELTRIAISDATFSSISVAFLDAYVRGKSDARHWLDASAPGWLTDGDRLKRR